MDNITSNTCPLCLALREVRLPQIEQKIENTQLLKTNNFVVLPAIGPLQSGHVLVTSRGHFTNLSSMGKEAILEYVRISGQIAAHNTFRNKNYLVYENGSTEEESAGSCIPHMHIHWIPGLGQFDKILSGLLPILNNVENLHDLSEIITPYIYIESEIGKPIFYQAFKVEPQFVRQLICESLDRDDWDWSEDPKMEWISETVAMWKDHPKND